MVKKNTNLYDSINMDAISCFDLEAKLERGGARQQSTLPPELNKEAMEIATKVYYDKK